MNRIFYKNSGTLDIQFFNPCIQGGSFYSKHFCSPQITTNAPVIAEATECCNEIEVEFSKSQMQINWNPSYESILDLAEAHGLSPDYSCRSGICHTCKCKLEHGEVDYVMEPMDLPPKGEVLICCSKPKTDIVIQI